MTALPGSLIQGVATVACELSADQAGALALELEELQAPKMLRQVAGLAAPKAVSELCELWKAAPSVSGVVLADALRASAVAVKTTSSYEKVETLVTGPSRGGMRRSLQGLLEVIRGARTRLWVISYVLRGGVDEVLFAVQDRVEAGVEVNVLLDHLADNASLAFDRVAKLAPGARPLIWLEEHRVVGDTYANLHAKCAVADGRQALISSANLTEWAMGRNLEVGLLVTGGATPRALDTYFRLLLDEGKIADRPELA